ncbi:MAG: hypothetical protein O2800_00335 [Planctomycetota bacterium]|nr:hypothetical protein [Planctomycetota bacterium]
MNAMCLMVRMVVATLMLLEITGCTGIPTEVTESRPALVEPRPSNEYGLELVSLTVRRNDPALRSFLAALRTPDGVNPDHAERLQRNGISLVVLNESQLVALITSMGGVLAEKRSWFGQCTSWQSATRAMLVDVPRIFVDGRMRTAGTGAVSLLCMGWTVPEPDGTVVDVTFVASALAESAGSLSVTVKPTLAGTRIGQFLAGTSAFFSLHSGELGLVTSAPTARTRSSRGPDSGVEADVPPTPGELLLTSTYGSDPIVTILLFVPILPSGDDSAEGSVELPTPTP